MVRSVFLFVLVVSVQSLGVYGWWDTGHMLVSQIAYKHLQQQGATTPEVLTALENSVNSLVSYSEASNTFVTAACWMDDIKTRGMVQLSSWHFINLPICDWPGSNDTDACNGTSVEDVLTTTNEDALLAIQQGLTTLRSSTALGFERGFAFRNLLHIVGDLHQPLHAVARFAPETPSGDHGGNLFLLNTPDYSNLHKLWDSGVGMLNNYIQRPLNASAAAYLSDTADQIIARTANLTYNVTTYNITEWAIESRDLAITYVYNLTYDSVPSDYYISQGWEVVQDQLGLAGYRLYLLLKQIHPCVDATNNCPSETPSTPSTPKKEQDWMIAAIALAVAFGISFICNALLFKRSRSGYERVDRS